jgi:DNA-binding GntR family transcriptional regulator
MPVMNRAVVQRTGAKKVDTVKTADLDRPPQVRAANAFTIARLPEEVTYKTKAYRALKEAIANMDLYRSSEPVMLDERELSEGLGVSRTPIREALAMLQQEGFIRVLPRRGIMVVRRSKREIIEMIQAWAALESMAARLITLNASDEEIATLRSLFQSFRTDHEVLDHVDEYSAANIAFHQALIRLSGSETLATMTSNLTIHLRAIRHRTIFEMNRAQRSFEDHIQIIEALEARDTELAERLARDHTLTLADHVEKHVDLN